MKKYWGYVIKQQRHKSLESFKTAVKAPLSHLFNEHDHCSTEWCLAKRAIKEGKVYISKDGPYLDRIKDKEVYDDIKSVVDRFSTDERLNESLHMRHTQSNEMLNMSLTFFNPKNVN